VELGREYPKRGGTSAIRGEDDGPIPSSAHPPHLADGQTLMPSASQRRAMKALAVVGTTDAQTEAGVAAVVAALRDRGDRVAVLTHHDEGTAAVDSSAQASDTSATYREAGASRTVDLASDGAWVETGADRTLDDALDALATDHDTVVVADAPDADLPTVALGDADAAGPVVASAPDADALDADDVRDAVADAPERETLDSLVAQVEAHADSEYAGAVATFTGRVRERDHPDDAPTEHLEFQRYDAVAEQRMATIREELCARDGVYDVRMHHRTGVVPAGEDVVHVVVLAGHRTEAFETVSDGIDRLKDEVPLFKREVTVDEAFWRHEQPE